MNEKLRRDYRQLKQQYRRSRVAAQLALSQKGSKNTITLTLEDIRHSKPESTQDLISTESIADENTSIKAMLYCSNSDEIQASENANKSRVRQTLIAMLQWTIKNFAFQSFNEYGTLDLEWLKISIH